MWCIDENENGMGAAAAQGDILGVESVVIGVVTFGVCVCGWWSLFRMLTQNSSP